MNNRKAFTIVELLTSIAIIALLISILLPSIAMVRRSAKETAQKAQFATIEMALDAFKQDYGDYPPSDRFEHNNPSGNLEYCGSMKLAEALLGWDLQGFHLKTAWRRDGYDAFNVNGTTTYDPGRTRIPSNATLFERKGPYLELATTPVFHVGVSGPGKNDGLYVLPNPTVMYAYNYVICDVFGVRKLAADNTSKTVVAGTPILYYKANTASKDITNPVFENRIYNFKDNQDLVVLGKLTPSGAKTVNHPLLYGSATASPRFYEYRFKYILTDPPPPGYGGSGIGYGIKDPKIATPWPYHPDSYILISAGMDGLYGTEDDIHNY